MYSLSVSHICLCSLTLSLSLSLLSFVSSPIPPTPRLRYSTFLRSDYVFDPSGVSMLVPCLLDQSAASRSSNGSPVATLPLADFQFMLAAADHAKSASSGGRGGGDSDDSEDEEEDSEDEGEDSGIPRDICAARLAPGPWSSLGRFEPGSSVALVLDKEALVATQKDGRGAGGLSKAASMTADHAASSSNSAGQAGGEKRRMSKAERKRQKKQRGGGTAASLALAAKEPDCFVGASGGDGGQSGVGGARGGQVVPMVLNLYVMEDAFYVVTPPERVRSYALALNSF